MSEPKTAPTVQEKLTAARAAAAKRAAERQEAADLAELERLELLEKYEAELGPVGQKFDVLDLTEYGEGHIVVKLGTPAYFAKAKEDLAKAKTPSEEEVATHHFVEPHVVHPALADFRRIVGERPVVLVKLGHMLHGLYGERAERVGKKA